MKYNGVALTAQLGHLGGNVLYMLAALHLPDLKQQLDSIALWQQPDLELTAVAMKHSAEP